MDRQFSKVRSFRSRIKYFQASLTGFITIVTSTAPASVHWTRQASNTSWHLHSVAFYDEMNGFCVGDKGTLIFTNDGGQNWSLRDLGTENDLKSIQLIGPDHGYICGNAGIVFHTEDGGETWNRTNLGSEYHCNDIHFINTQIGWVVGGAYRYDLRSNTHFAFKTIDGGTSWNPVEINDSMPFNSVSFSDTLHGYIVGGGYSYPGSLSPVSMIWRTRDGGLHWDMPSGMQGNMYYDVFPVSEGVCWVAGKECLRRTMDGGDTWVVPDDYPYDEFTWWPYYSIYFSDYYTGWAVGFGGIIIRTDEAGNQWRLQSSGTNENLLSVFFVNNRVGWAVGEFGVVLKTRDGGDDKKTVKMDYKLYQNYPNPFCKSRFNDTFIPVQVANKKTVQIEILDVFGRLVRWLDMRVLENQWFHFYWNGADDSGEIVPSGIYFCRMTTENSIESIKIIFIR